MIQQGEPDQDLNEQTYSRLYRLERQRAQALAAIGAAGREIASSPDLARTLHLVMDKAAETLPLDAGVLFLLDKDSHHFQVAVSYNLSPERVSRITLAFDEGVPGWVVNHQRALIIDDATIDPRVHPDVVREQVLSVLAVPLITRGNVIGVLNLFCQTGKYAFDEEARQLAQAYADQTAIFIENARLMDALRQSAIELEQRVERRTQQLREKQAQIIRAEKMAAVGRLAASIAHEVNNPLQAITLHLTIIAEEQVNNDAQYSMEVVQQELDRITRIVQGLLDFQRPKHGQSSPQDVVLLLDNVLNLAQKQLQRANVTVRRFFAPKLPPVLAVGDQIEQVFLNLLLNAVDAMPHGGELHIRAHGENGTVSISFIDKGIGMSAEVLGQLFEPFFTTKRNGSGLGLAVSHEIVANHGGKLLATSHIGKGSTFTVILPQHTPKPPAPSTNLHTFEESQ